jgi:Tol biopolymer transport system component
MWAADARGTNPIQLTSMGFIPGYGRWSPDGKTIAFHSNPEGHGDIFVVSADGGKPRKLTDSPATDTFPCFSRDGQWIYFTSNRTGDPSIWKLPASGGDAVRVSPGRGVMSVESPDGEYLYYSDSDSERPGPLLRLSLKSREVVRILENVPWMNFAVIDKGIYYLERVLGDTRLKYFDLATRQSTVIAGNLGNVGGGLTASRDGRSILYSRVDSSVDDVMLVENFR